MRRTRPTRAPGGPATVLMLRSLAALLLSLCAVEILRLTLTPSPASIGIAHANLHPLATIRLYLRYGTLREQILQIGGNIAIGVPLGFLLPQITPRLRGLIRVVLVTAVFVTLIELTQWAFVRGRAFDVDDVILAAVGAVIGYVPLGRMFGLRLHPQHLHWWQRLFRGGSTDRRETAQPATPATAAKSGKTRARAGASAKTTAATDDPQRARSRSIGGALGFRSSRGTASTAAARSGAASDN